MFAPARAADTAAEFVSEYVEGNTVPTLNSRASDRSKNRNHWFDQPSSVTTSTTNHAPHPQTTPPEIAAKIIEVSLSRPLLGCCKLAELLRHNSILISSPTVQKILIKHQLASRRDRAMRVLELARMGHEISALQRVQVERILRIKT